MQIAIVYMRCQICFNIFTSTKGKKEVSAHVHWYTSALKFQKPESRHQTTNTAGQSTDFLTPGSGYTILLLTWAEGRRCESVADPPL
jgi:hypothetical protein